MALTDLCTFISSSIPVYFMIWNCKELLPQRKNSGCDWANKSFSIQIGHREINHSTMAPHPPCKIHERIFCFLYKIICTTHHNESTFHGTKHFSWNQANTSQKIHGIIRRFYSCMVSVGKNIIVL